MAFLVRRPGVTSLLVDAGRAGWQHRGVPRGGPADRAAWQLGNALLGNDPHATALEVTLHGPTLEATARHRLVVYGAPFNVKHRSSDQALKPVPPGHVFTVEAGDEVHVPAVKESGGLRAYVCVPGGFHGEPILHSQSALSPLAVGHTLQCASEPTRHPERWFQLDPWPESAPRGVLRLLPGTHLTRRLRQALLRTTFTISTDSNRMGVRLTSSVPWAETKRDLVSAPVTPGTIQLPGGGQPIILGVDAQTIGGYPRLGHVIDADLDALGQLRPRDRLRFELVTLDTAETLRASRERWLRLWLQRLQHA